MKTTKLILVGGFLGAGKTTLLWEAAQQITKKSLRIGLITNDQAPELVDSALLSHEGLKVAEVSGSCFCCNFNGFTDVIQQIRSEESTDVILAEPVGSCTDLSATIIQPLKQYWNRELQVAPLTVLADPFRLSSILSGGTAGLHPDAAYIYRKQLEESDIILLTKTDLLTPEELNSLKEQTCKMYSTAKVMEISALSGNGIDRWLEEVMVCNNAGRSLAEVDYDIYANGEAVLGWLNGTIRLQGKLTDWNAFTHQLLSELSRRFDDSEHAVGHVKVITENGDRFVVGNLTGNFETRTIRGSAGYSNESKLIINARVEMSPENLDKMIRDTLDKMISDKYTTDVVAWRYLQPGRPQPTHRFEQIVS